MFPRRYSTFAPCLRFCGGPLLWAAEGCFRSFPFSEDGPLARNPAALNIRYYAIILRSDIRLLRGCGVTSSFHRPKEFDRYKYRPAEFGRGPSSQNTRCFIASRVGACGKNEKWRAMAATRISREKFRKFAARGFRHRRRRTGSQRFRAVRVDVTRTCTWPLLCVNPV